MNVSNRGLSLMRMHSARRGFVRESVPKHVVGAYSDSMCTTKTADMVLAAGSTCTAMPTAFSTAFGAPAGHYFGGTVSGTTITACSAASASQCTGAVSSANPNACSLITVDTCVLSGGSYMKITQSGLPPTSPGAEPGAVGAVVYKVSTQFMLSGSPSDYYNAAAQTAIKTVLATEADVSTAAVSLTLTAGSVIVAADVSFGTSAGATWAASRLSAGVLANAAALETALNAQFAALGLSLTTTVRDILVAPVVVSPTSGSDVGMYIGISVGVVVVLGLILAALYMVRKAKKRARTDLKARDVIQM